MSEKILAWHFLREDRKLRFHPYTEVISGQTLTYEGVLTLCEAGLHASERVINALYYAPGPVVSRVELSGQILKSDDKACASKRACLWIADATRALHEFACWCAEETLKRERSRGREPDERCWKAIEAKRLWLAGRIDSKGLHAARDASWYAARGASWGAARDEQNRKLESMLFELQPTENP